MTGAAVIARWFEARRWLALGITGGAMSASQLVIIPLATVLTLTLGWRVSFLGLGVAPFVLCYRSARNQWLSVASEI